MFKNSSLPFQGFLQASGLLGYILLVASLITYLEDNEPSDQDEILAGVAFILLFVTSATISALIVFGRAAQLFLQKKQDRAFKLVGWTLGWMVGYFVVFVSIFVS